MTKSSFDAVIVGSGPGGCVAARRLADCGQKVALLEAGPALPLPTSLRSVGAVGLADMSSLTWPDLSVSYGYVNTNSAESTVDGSSAEELGRRYWQGRAIGGSSAINSMVLSPGDENDYVDWVVRHGCTDWGPGIMRAWLNRAADSLPVQSVALGPVTATVMEMLSSNLMDDQTTRALTSLDLGAIGLVEASLAARNGQRCTVFDALIADRHLVDPSLLQVSAETVVSRVVIDRGVATGVETVDGKLIRARNTVLAAGAIGTPKLLHRSLDAPNQIGRSITDHPSFSFALHTPRGESSPVDASPSAISKIFRFSTGDKGAKEGDIQVLVLEGLPKNTGSGEAEAAHKVLSVVIVTLLSVTSTGRIEFGSDSNARVNRGCLATPTDRRRFRLGVRQVALSLLSFARAGGHSGSSIEVAIDDKGRPLPDLLEMTDDQLDRWLIAHPGPVAHLSGACRMGPSASDGAVTSCDADSPGRVYGVSNLYVADSSVLPGLTSGGPQIPVMAVSDRIASAIAGVDEPSLCR